MQHALCMFIKLITCYCTAPSLVKWWLLKFVCDLSITVCLKLVVVTLRLTDI